MAAALSPLHHDNTAKVWDSATGKEIASLNGHTSSVWSAAFSPDGRRIVTASDDNTAKVWPAPDLNYLVERGCHWLRNWLRVNPQDLLELDRCQTPDLTRTAAPYLKTESEQLAKAGQITQAVAGFKTAQQWNPDLFPAGFDPTAHAQQLAAENAEPESR